MPPVSHPRYDNERRTYDTMSSAAITENSVLPGPGAHAMRITPMTNGGHGSGSNSGAGKAPYRHIEDLVSVGVDLDPHTPLRKVLEIGDAHMRQAMTYNDFRRPDLALQEYIKAFTIAVDKVPRHKDYPSLKSDPGQLNRLYNALKTKITTNGAVFDKIKEDIKEDNRRSGAKPTSSSKISAELTRMQLSNAPPATIPQARTNSSTDTRSNGIQNAVDTSNQNGNTNNSDTSIRGEPQGKPPVQPKPRALHGNAIRQVSKESPEDLASRFARLRDSQKPEKPGNPPTLPLVNTSTPEMPKLPEAIYSPARGTVTSEIANLPSSTPRGMFSRTNSIASAPTTSARSLTENTMAVFNMEQFATAQSYYSSQPPSQATQVKIPQGEIIAAATLANLMARGVQILLIDVRDRQAFDEGHIRSPRTICVEPEILMRENISADEIADSMVLAPPNEKLAIEQRDKVDLVVFYDQQSAYVPTRITGDPREMVLHSIRQALSHYSYSRPLRNSPKLLNGGLASWLNEFGEISLETSDTASKYMPLSARSTARSQAGRQYRTRAKTLTQGEIDQFEGLIQEDRMGIPEFDYVKSRDDFVRRYPSIGGNPESMIAPIHREFDSQHHEFVSDMALAPPSRPAPAVPRTRYSGLESRDDEADIGAIAMATTARSQSTSDRRMETGLMSDGTWCYCNSTLQALIHTPGFIDEILEPEWPENWRHIETFNPTRPQLMGKILKNLFRWMHGRSFKAIRATTLLQYIRSLSTRYMTDNGAMIRLGDQHQHDVDEICSFFHQQLAAETNVTTRTPLRLNPIPRNANSMVEAAHARLFLNMQTRREINFMDKHFHHNNMVAYECTQCHKVHYIIQDEVHIIVRSLEKEGSSLEEALEEDRRPATVNVTCSQCGAKEAIEHRRFLSLPRILRVMVLRYEFNMNTGAYLKRTYPFEFPEDIDLDPWTVDLPTRQQIGSLANEPYNRNLAVPTEYDLYAIITHRGNTVNSGHYWTHTRTQQKDKWTLFNDSQVSFVQGKEWHTTIERLQECVDYCTPVQLFYKRRDIPFDWEKALGARTQSR
ncbi:cysteine proteinase [Rostrohypoxylon terebratum]|nr:cysteine proteinase [Rostrohypoxylon terebratum]